MVLYVSRSVATIPKLRSLPQKLKQGLEQRLVDHANGMFLWSKLLLGELSRQRTQRAIETTLDNLPRGLTDTYNRILETIDAGGQYIQKIFRCMSLSVRPVTTKELKLILELDPDGIGYDPSLAILDPIEDLLRWSCGGLVEIEDYRVQFIHFTVKEYWYRRSVRLSMLTRLRGTEISRRSV